MKTAEFSRIAPFVVFAGVVLAACNNPPLEASDDGNDIEDDECTNACQLPACGDGILQPNAGEACDDGNVLSGDACTQSCALPGTLIWEQVIDISEMEDDAGYEVVIDSEDNIGVLLTTGGVYRLVEFDNQGVLLWNFGALNTDKPNLVIGSGDELVIGGKTNGNQGVTRLYDTAGNLLWTENIAAANSSIIGVGIDAAGNVVSAGRHVNSDALLVRYDNMSNILWSHFENDGGALGPVYVDSDGQIWNVRENPRQLETYTPDGQADWTSAMLEDQTFEDLAVDAEGNVYLLAVALDVTALSISKWDNAGMLVWEVEHDDPGVLEFGGGLAVLPNGGVLISGATNGAPGEADGLLAWYDADGNSLVPDAVIDGDADTDFDVLYDLAIDLEDGYGVAVGAQEPNGANSDLWIRKIEI